MQASDRLVLSPSTTDMEESKRSRLTFLDDQEKRLREAEVEKQNGYMSTARERGLKLLIQKVKVATERVQELIGDLQCLESRRREKPSSISSLLFWNLPSRAFQL